MQQYEEQFSCYLMKNLVILKNETGLTLDTLREKQLAPIRPDSFHFDPVYTNGINELNYMINVSPLSLNS